MGKIGGCKMSAPDLSKELNDLIDRIGHAEPTVDNILIFAFLEELRERRKVRHPDCIKKYLNLLEEMKYPEDVVVISAEHTILQWVLTPEEKQ